MGRGNVGTVRIALPWQEIDPGPAANDLEWDRFDEIVAGAARHQIDVLPTVYTVPHLGLADRGVPHAVQRPLLDHPAPHRLRAQLLAFVPRCRGCAATAPTATFWEGHPTVPYRPIDAWQIWNEQNSPGFFQPRPNPERYADLLRAASEAIGGRDDSAQIVIGGLFGYPLNGRDGGLRATEYLRALYAIPDIEAAFDGVAVHPYASRISGVVGQMRRINQIITQAGDDRATLWVTEIGWASGGSNDEPLNRGPRGPGEAAAAGVRVLRREARGDADRGGPLVRVAGRPAPRRHLQMVRAIRAVPARLAGEPEARLERVHRLHRRVVTPAS